MSSYLEKAFLVVVFLPWIVVGTLAYWKKYDRGYAWRLWKDMWDFGIAE